MFVSVMFAQPGTHKCNIPVQGGCCYDPGRGSSPNWRCPVVAMRTTKPHPVGKTFRGGVTGGLTETHSVSKQWLACQLQRKTQRCMDKQPAYLKPLSTVATVVLCTLETQICSPDVVRMRAERPRLLCCGSARHSNQSLMSI